MLIACGVLFAAPAAGQAAKPGVGVDARSGAIAITGLGGGALAESKRDAAGPGGRIGFETPDGWFHATEASRITGSSRNRRIELDTDDPAGGSIRMHARIKRGGVVAIDASARGAGDVRSIGIGFGARGAERYLGFGERSNAVDQRGNTIENYVGEGPFEQLDYPIMRTQIPPWGLRERPDATYFPMPWLLSTRGFGALLRNHETSRFRLGSEDAGEWSVEVDAAKLKLRVFAGSRPAAALRRLTETLGRQPKPFAPWQLGPWVQTGHQNTEPEEGAHLEALRAADAPVSAVETHMRYMPCGSDLGQEEQERARTAGFHAAGLAAVTYTREAVCETYADPYARALAENAFLRRADGTPYTFPAFVGSGQTEVGMLDFTNPAATDIYRSILDRPYANGYDGWMEDYGEYAPPDSVAANGMNGARMHNYYPVAYHRAGYRYARSQKRPLVRFVRSGWTGVQRYAQVVWGGDPSTTWGFDGLESSVTQALTMGLSGVSSWGSDIGGFFTLTSPPLGDELLARWIQFGAVSGVMRTKAEGIGIAQDTRPQVWEEPTLAIWRRYAKLRTQLYPLLVAADRHYRRTGMPLMRHLSLAYPNDRRAVATDDQFLFTGRFLAAPVVTPGSTEREIYLPRGKWIDLWRSVDYREGSGGFNPGRARILRGARDITLPAPLDELPLLVKAGSLLPMLPADVDTLADYGKRAEGMVRLRDRRDRLHLIAFPRGRTVQRFYENGKLSSDARGGVWKLRIDSPRELRIELDASLGAMRGDFAPRSVTVDGRKLRSWDYDRETEVLSARIPKGAGELVVRAARRDPSR